MRTRAAWDSWPGSASVMLMDDAWLAAPVAMSKAARDSVRVIVSIERSHSQRASCANSVASLHLPASGALHMDMAAWEKVPGMDCPARVY